MLAIWSRLAELPDPRSGNARRHKLLDVLTIALTASICGAESCVDFADFARDREALLRDFLELPGGVPSHDTFSRLFWLLDPAAFACCFASFLNDLGEGGPGVIAIDGKTMRRSFDRAAKKSVLHVVTAFAADARMTIGQVAAGDKESEIPAARSLLGLIDLTGALVTGDALHCQGETARLIKDRGGDWLFTLKANRPCNTPRSGTGSLTRPANRTANTQRPTPITAGSRCAVMPSATTSAGCRQTGAIPTTCRCRVWPRLAWWNQR